VTPPPDWAAQAALDALNTAKAHCPLDPDTATRDDYLKESAVNALMSIAMSLQSLAAAQGG
jgi:hypothetical protein